MSNIKSATTRPYAFRLPLERTAYNRWHIQPSEVYKQLGYTKRTDCTEPAWDCYLKLKETYEVKL